MSSRIRKPVRDHNCMLIHCCPAICKNAPNDDPFRFRCRHLNLKRYRLPQTGCSSRETSPLPKLAIVQLTRQFRRLHRWGHHWARFPTHRSSALSTELQTCNNLSFHMVQIVGQASGRHRHRKRFLPMIRSKRYYPRTECRKARAADIGRNGRVGRRT